MDDTLPPRNLFPSPAVTPGSPVPSSMETAEFDSITTGSIGAYSIVERLGVGGMGVVYKCRDEPLHRFVAIKILRRKYAGDEHYRRRFQREAQTIASLSHPSVAHVYGIGELERPEGPLTYIVMEYVEGPSLEALLHKEGRIPLPKAAALLRQTALGLREAFWKGIVHRDIKPSNIIVTASGGVKIVDFGLAKELKGQNSMTDEGIVLGTPHYISPEQGQGRPVDHRSDVYSLGSTFYHMLTGRPPFEGNSQVSVIVAHVNDTPRAPHEVDPELPEAASHVVLKMMAKAAEDRYQNYDDLIEDLDALEEGIGPRHAAAIPAVAEAQVSALSGKAPEEVAEPPASPRRFARRWWVFSGGLLLLATTGVVFGHLVTSGRPPSVPGLGSWYRRLEDGRDLVDMPFAKPPAERAGIESWHRWILLPQGTVRLGTPPRLEDGTLQWENFSGPFALGLEFTEVHEIRVAVGPTSGSFDLGIALVHPGGSQDRSLLLRLRPGEDTPHPLLATRSGEEIRPRRPGGGREGREDLASGDLPGVPRLGQGPFEIFLSFERRARTTGITVRIVKRGGTPPFYQSDCEIEGTDWPSGVLVLLSPSFRLPFKVSLNRILVSGRLAEQPAVEEIPWRS